MSSAIKNALTKAFPGTRARDWKRRTEARANGVTERSYEHDFHGMVKTVEAPDGSITIPDQPDTSDIAETPEEFFQSAKLRLPNTRD